MRNINTVNTKREQLMNGFFKIGSGEDCVLIIGSCRVVPYVGYLDFWNTENNNRFTIYFLDPYNWNYDLSDNRVNLEDKINSLETDSKMLSMLSKVKIFVHEFYINYGMFNCSKVADKNIYKFGLKPEIDICIPSWNDKFVLFGDIVSFDVEMRKKAIADYNVTGKLSEQTQQEIFNVGHVNIRKFLEVCLKSDVPEMSDYFMLNFIEKRFYWNFNHVSKHFTLAIFKFINDKFLHLDISDKFMKEISQHDMYANNYTYLTEYDIKWYDYNWNEIVKPLKEKL